MHNATLYNSAKGMQTKDAEENLAANIDKMRWDVGGDILDVGCGDGDITFNLLMKKIPRNPFKIVGTDLSFKMIEYANNTYANNDQISFEVLDIAAKTIDSSHLRKYQHVFSFMCLHWVQDQK